MIITVALVLAWIVLLTLVLAVIALGRQIAALNRRVPAWGARGSDAYPQVGERAPEFDLEALDGGRISSIDLATDRATTLLVFVSPGCTACEELAPAMRAMNREREISVMVASSAPPDRLTDFLTVNRLKESRAVSSAELADAYGVATTPFAVLIDDDGIVRGKGLVNSREHLESLFQESGVAIEDSKEAYGVG
jgi:methylamine dehydrogenase accessory protein MauD